jgi:hypothetical protein
MSTVTVHNDLNGEVEAPEHIIERTENILGMQPMTNQRLIMDTAQWWFDNCGNCPIYRWCIHHLDTLEHDEIMDRVAIYSDARAQGQELGLDV